MDANKGSPCTPASPERHLKVAHFAGTLRPGHDGVTRVLYRLADGLAQENIDAVFFSPILPEDPCSCCPMYRVPSVPFPLYREYRLALPGACHISGRLQEFMPNLLHIHSPCTLGYSAVMYGRRHGIPVVATYHTHFSSYAKYYNLPAMESISWKYFRMLYSHCRRVYVPSLPMMAELERKSLRNLELLPHGVDTRQFSPAFRSEEWRRSLGAGGKYTLLYVGRLVWEKDLKTLIETYRVLSGKRSDWKLILVGDGPIRSDLQAGMPEAIFLGHLSGRSLSTAYSSSDILVFPSTTETFGNVGLEAMASGIVPICVREGGSHGIIRDGVTGYAANPRDAADMVRHIEYLCDHQDHYHAMAADALAFARTQSWDAILHRLADSYMEVLAATDAGGASRKGMAAYTFSGFCSQARRVHVGLAGG